MNIQEKSGRLGDIAIRSFRSISSGSKKRDKEEQGGKRREKVAQGRVGGTSEARECEDACWCREREREKEKERKKRKKRER